MFVVGGVRGIYLCAPMSFEKGPEGLVEEHRVSCPGTDSSRTPLGITHTHTGIRDASSPVDFTLFGEKIIPEAAKF